MSNSSGPPTPPDSDQIPENQRQLFEFVFNLQRSLDLTEVANVAVNDGRLLCGVDRVSLVLRRGRRTVVVAVSGQESVHPRSNLIRAMAMLCDKAIAAGEPFLFDGTLESLPPPLETALAQFIQEAASRYLLIVPLFAPSRLVPAEDPSDSRKSEQRESTCIGCLAIEQMSNSQPTRQLKSNIDVIIPHIGAAICNAESHSTIFLLPLWRSIGRFLERLRGWRLTVAGLIVLAILLSGGALAFIPWEYRVDATGRLMPVIQREVFAPWDGEVVELRVQGGEHVEVGQILLILRSDELSAELVTIENKIHEKRKLLLSLQAQHDVAEKQADRDESVKLQGKIVETNVEIEGASIQATVLHDRLERLTIKAPIAGVVTTFQVEQLLLNRPVRRGDVLLQVMDDSGDWRLEMEIAEQRIGRILQAQKRAHQSGAGDLGLPITFCLLTQPEANYDGNLTSLATRTVTAETQGSILEATGSVDKSRLPGRLIGAEVRARIGCGPTSLGDVLFGDVVEFVEKYLWW